MKKPGLAIIIARKAKESMEKENGKEVNYDEMGKELLNAIKSGNSKELTSLLKDFIKTCEE